MPFFLFSIIIIILCQPPSHGSQSIFQLLHSDSPSGVTSFLSVNVQLPGSSSSIRKFIRPRHDINNHQHFNMCSSTIFSSSSNASLSSASASYCSCTFWPYPYNTTKRTLLYCYCEELARFPSSKSRIVLFKANPMPPPTPFLLCCYLFPDQKVYFRVVQYAHRIRFFETPLSSECLLIDVKVLSKFHCLDSEATFLRSVHFISLGWLGFTIQPRFLLS
ncbi:hypothetical protein BKA70DRAFT_827631 [Coprinopsis sp. MPI-PUGE-AT-0042]|nr:hypothetical protein BKA70DRAFT_827631 [Coprinopsis sp. MPI-PUGE-AT-0042]